MGYTTNFNGSWTVTPALDAAQLAYLRAFNGSRRMKYNPNIVQDLPDPLRVAVGLPVGVDGCYYVNGNFQIWHDTAEKLAAQGIVDHNRPPEGQPGLWCNWVPSKDGTRIKWDEGEKFYKYTEWIAYLIHHFLKPWECELDGTVLWQGEEYSDLGKIEITDNLIRVYEGAIDVHYALVGSEEE